MAKKKVSARSRKPAGDLGQDPECGLPAFIYRRFFGKTITLAAVDIGSVRSGLAVARCSVGPEPGAAGIHLGRICATAVELKTRRGPGALSPVARALRMAEAIESLIQWESAIPDLILYETPGGAGAFTGGRGLVTLGITIGAVASALHRIMPEGAVRPVGVDVGTWARLYGAQALPKPARAALIAPELDIATDTPHTAHEDAIDAGGLLAWSAGKLVHPKGLSKPVRASGLAPYIRGGSHP